MQEPEALANESWFNSRWRPAMAWQYFAVCLFDFIIFPATTQMMNNATGGHAEWHSLTLQGGGLYHLAMGAVLGIAAWQRTQEKMAIYNASGNFSGGGFGAVDERTTDRVTPATNQKSSRSD